MHRRLTPLAFVCTTLVSATLACGGVLEETCGPGEDTTDEARLVEVVAGIIATSDDLRNLHSFRIFETEEDLTAVCETCFPRIDVDLSLFNVVVVEADDHTFYTDATGDEEEIVLHFNQEPYGGNPSGDPRQIFFRVPKERAIDVSVCELSGSPDTFGAP